MKLKMHEDLTVLHRSTASGSGRPQLRGILAVHLALDRARGWRETVGWLLLALSLPVWIAAFRPDWLPSDVRRLALASWFVVAVAFVISLVSESRCRRRLANVTDPAQGTRPS